MIERERKPRRHSWAPASEKTNNHVDGTRIALKAISPQSTKNLMLTDLQSRARRHSTFESPYLDGSPRKNRLCSIFSLHVKCPKEKTKSDSASSPRACSLPTHEGNCIGDVRASEHSRNVSEWFRERQTKLMANESFDGGSMFDIIGKSGEDFRSFVLNEADHPEYS
jgi:hypothetical protein